MAKLSNPLNINRCPHCNVDTPNITAVFNTRTAHAITGQQKTWYVYICNRCGGLITAAASNPNEEISEIYPNTKIVDSNIPARARTFLEQAIESLHAPSGAIMLASSSIDAMLKDKNYKEGRLYNRIDKATEDHLLTSDMAKWAHQVRLDANEERHADDKIEKFPNENDANKTVNFALALAEFLYVLPAKVTNGIEDSKNVNNKEI